MQTTRYAERVRSFYEGEVARHGFTYRGLGYNQRESQLRRFRVLSEVAPLHRKRVLDVGAGTGDFLHYLVEQGVRPEYTGLELCDHLTRAARASATSIRGVSWRFYCGDILDPECLPAHERYDYVVASGIFGLKTEDTEARIMPTLERLFALCERAVAVNFLSARAARHAERSSYVEPGEALSCAFRLTPAVVLRHDYLPNDFTLVLYREPRWPQGGREQ